MTGIACLLHNSANCNIACPRPPDGPGGTPGARGVGPDGEPKLKRRPAADLPPPEIGGEAAGAGPPNAPRPGIEVDQPLTERLGVASPAGRSFGHQGLRDARRIAQK